MWRTLQRPVVHVVVLSVGGVRRPRPEPAWLLGFSGALGRRKRRGLLGELGMQGIALVVPSICLFLFEDKRGSV